ncbi:TPM domain-containing protein [Corynebacterium aquatimens]
MIAGGFALAAAPAALAATHYFDNGPHEIVAQAPATVQGAPVDPTDLREKVVDQAGVLSGSEKGDIEAAITQLQERKSLNAYVVYMTTFGGEDPDQWAKTAVNDRGSNTAVVAIATEDRKYAIATGGAWNDSQEAAMEKAAFAQLSNQNFPAAGLAAINSVNGSGGGDGEGGPDGALLAGGVGAAALAGGGFYAYGRRKEKKNEADQITAAKELKPGDVDSLGRLPTPTLEKLAKDTLVQTDESIRVGKEELEIARDEFGADRVRPFTAAMNEATAALQRAFRIHQRLYDAIPETEPEKRAMLIDIVSSCGKAEDALNMRSKQFTDLRNLLIKAPDEIEAIIRRIIDLRARIEPAQATLADLHQRYTDEVLQSIADNIDVANGSIAEAEDQLNTARKLADQPAGQQGALVDVLRAAQHAVEVADTNLTAIEHAEANIARARQNLNALIDEIEDELDQIEQLKRETTQGALVDVAALNTVSERARAQLAELRGRADSDPLDVYTRLTHLDSEIDAEIDRARGVVSDQQRKLQLFDQQMNVATAQIQSAEDLINSRGRIIGSQARTLLAESKRQYAEAHNRRVDDTANAIEFARAATDTSRRASQAAQADVAEYRRMQTNQTMGDIAQAVIWASILGGGGGGGGFGGGFGGGGGGGFSGGGTTSRSGSF